MTTLTRFLLIVVAILVAILTMSFAIIFGSTKVFLSFVDQMGTMFSHGGMRLLIVVILLTLFGLSIYFIVLLIQHGNLRKARVKNSVMGSIDVGVSAIETLALNAAKSAQAGVKNCRASIQSGKENKLFIHLFVVTYADVEIPPMMEKLQNRVATDVEKYTGIEVAEVHVKVSNVEDIDVKVRA